MPTRNVRCIVTEPSTEIAYDVDANYRCVCSYGHDTREEHLCDLTLRAGPVDKPDERCAVRDLAAVPTPVLVAIQSRLRVILAGPANHASRLHSPPVLSTGRT